ncbi:hypothetical protein AMB3_1345 [plant metagenome]
MALDRQRSGTRGGRINGAASASWRLPAAPGRAAPGAGHAGILDHAAQLHRPGQPRRAGPGAAHGRGRAHVLRAGRLRRHRGLCLGVDDRADRAFALAGPRGRPGRDGAAGLRAGRHHLAALGALPALGHHRLGPVAVLPFRQHGIAGQA